MAFLDLASCKHTSVPRQEAGTVTPFRSWQCFWRSEDMWPESKQWLAEDSGTAQRNKVVSIDYRQIPARSLSFLSSIAAAQHLSEVSQISFDLVTKTPDKARHIARLPASLCSWSCLTQCSPPRHSCELCGILGFIQVSMVQEDARAAVRFLHKMAQEGHMLLAVVGGLIGS